MWDCKKAGAWKWGCKLDEDLKSTGLLCRVLSVSFLRRSLLYKMAIHPDM